MRKLIGLAGPKNVGKTTTAEGTGYKILSFATPLKEGAVELTGLPMKYFTDQKLKEEKLIRLGGNSPREFLQKLGTEFCRGLYDKFWTIRMEAEIVKYYCDVVIDDIRFQEEADIIVRLGGDVIELVRQGVPYTREHASECGIICYDKFYLGQGIEEDSRRFNREFVV